MAPKNRPPIALAQPSGTTGEHSKDFRFDCVGTGRSDRTFHVEHGFNNALLARHNPGADAAHSIKMERDRLSWRELLIALELAPVITEQPQADGDLRSIGAANPDRHVRI